MLHVKIFHYSRDEKKNTKLTSLSWGNSEETLCVVAQIRHSNSLKNKSIIPCPEKALMTQKWAPNISKNSQDTPFCSSRGLASSYIASKPLDLQHRTNIPRILTCLLNFHYLQKHQLWWSWKGFPQSSNFHASRSLIWVTTHKVFSEFPQDYAVIFVFLSHLLNCGRFWHATFITNSTRSVGRDGLV